MIYTYFPFFLRTLLHPSHSFFTLDRTFIPRVCCVCPPIRTALNRPASAVMLVVGPAVRGAEAAIVGRSAELQVWRVRLGAAMAEERRVRRSGRRNVRASILTVEANLRKRGRLGARLRWRACGAGWTRAMDGYAVMLVLRAENRAKSARCATREV